MGCCASQQDDSNSWNNQENRKQPFFMQEIWDIELRLQHLQLYKAVIEEGSLDSVNQALQQFGKSKFTQLFHAKYENDSPDDYESIFQQCLNDSSLHILQYLHKNQIDFQWQATSTDTPLHLAIKNNSVDAVKWLCCHFWKTITFYEFGISQKNRDIAIADTATICMRSLFVTFIYRLMYCTRDDYNEIKQIQMMRYLSIIAYLSLMT